jgi:hypothetical protein
MRIMAHDALGLRVMFLGINARDFPPCAFFVGEIGMATYAKSATAINVQADRIFWVVIIGAMAVFATDGAVGGVFDVVILVFVTFSAGGGGLVFYRELFPLGLVGFSMPAIHIAALMDAEAFRYQQGPGDQDSCNNSQNYKQWSPDMVFQVPHLLILVRAVEIASNL